MAGLSKGSSLSHMLVLINKKKKKKKRTEQIKLEKQVHILEALRQW